MNAHGTSTGTYYAGIGSRNTPEPICQIMRRIALVLGQRGWTLRSGHAEGADQAFEAGAVDNGFPAEIFFARDGMTASSHWCQQLVTKFHPAPHRLGSYARALMARNGMQLFGQSGDVPVEFIVCWTPGGKTTGGTGQALRIAHAYDITVHNLGNPQTLALYENSLRRLDEDPTE